MTGQFFAIGKEQWDAACGLGLNPAVAFLVLARGTGRDNITTRWSADAVARLTGISWRRADAAIDALESAKLAINLSQPGKRPTRKLAFPDDMEHAIWLPNTLIDGVEGKSSPIARLRQTQNADYLHAFVDLYAMQDLAGDGGLPRSLIWQSSTCEHVCDAGQFRICGFSFEGSPHCKTLGPLARFYEKTEPKDGWACWKFLTALKNMGLLEIVHYLAESASPDAELIHPLTGDEDARAVFDAASTALTSLPEWVLHKAERSAYDYIVPVIRDIPMPAVVAVYRLTFRPHTKLTAAWWARHMEVCQRFTGIYSDIASGDYQQAIAS